MMATTRGRSVPGSLLRACGFLLAVASTAAGAQWPRPAGARTPDPGDAPGPAGAQTPGPPAGNPAPTPAPEIPGPSRHCSEPEYRQFDFWVGDWEVRTRDGNVAGTNRITRILDGCALREQWSGASGTRGTSLNVFDSGSGRWHQTWVDSSGLLLRLEGGLRDGRMVLSGVVPGSGGRTTHHRIAWEKTSERGVLQLWERSEDGGVTWSRVFEGLYTRLLERGGTGTP